MIRLVVFLGNPGREYAKTRHNAGRLLSQALPFSSSLSWQDKFQGGYASVPLNGGRLHLLAPQTWMNLSGGSVRACMGFFKILPEELLLAHDDVELPFGTLDFRRGGGLGGHNGLRSVQQCVASADFYRLRIGIGRPARGELASHVLGRFSPAEEARLPALLEKAAGILLGCAASPENVKSFL